MRLAELTSPALAALAAVFVAGRHEAGQVALVQIVAAGVFAVEDDRRFRIEGVGGGRTRSRLLCRALGTQRGFLGTASSRPGLLQPGFQRLNAAFIAFAHLLQFGADFFQLRTVVGGRRERQAEGNGDGACRQLALQHGNVLAGMMNGQPVSGQVGKHGFRNQASSGGARAA